MYNQYFAKLHPVIKIITTLLVMGIGFIVFMILSVIISVVFFDVTLNQISEISLNPSSNIGILKLFQTLQTIGLFIFPALLIGLLFGKNVFDYTYLSRKPYISSIVLVCIIGFTAVPFINFLATINAKLNLPEVFDKIEIAMKVAEERAQKLTELFLKVDTFGGLLFNLLMIAVLPAIGEELIFRGVFQRLFVELTKNKHLAIIITAIIFSAFHFQFYGFIPRFMLGVIFGYLLEWSKTLWLPIIAHFLNNAMAVVAYYLIQINSIQPDIERVALGGSSTVQVILSFLILCFLLYYVYHYESKKSIITN